MLAAVKEVPFPGSTLLQFPVERQLAVYAMLNSLRVNVAIRIFLKELPDGPLPLESDLAPFPRCIKEERDDGVLADVLGDILLRIIRPHLFLIDVLFENVTEDVRDDFVVPLKGAFVEMPTVGIEEREESLECPVGDGDRRAVKLFDLVGHEDAAVEIGHPPGNWGFLRAFFLGLGKPSKKRGQRKAG